jgi:hypothetical protein
MPEGYLMNTDERDRARLIRRTIERTLNQREAGQRPGIDVRQVNPLLQAWERDRAGRAANGAAPNRLTDGTRLRIEGGVA